MIYFFFQAGLKAYTFVIFMCFVVGFFFLLYKKLPETKGKSYDEIEKIFHMMDEENSGEEKLVWWMLCYVDGSKAYAARWFHELFYNLKKI